MIQTKEMLIASYANELKRMGEDPDYEGTEEQIKVSWDLAEIIETQYGWNWEEDDDASMYFAKATQEEIYKYIIQIVIPKLRLKNKCETCNGVGEVMLSCCTGEKVDEDIARCPKCKESLGEETCPDCEGTGIEPDTDVMFLIHPKDENREVFAFFPYKRYSKDPKMFTCYAHVGQHSGCHIEYAEESEFAVKEQYAGLEEELIGRGYNLKVITNKPF